MLYFCLKSRYMRVKITEITSPWGTAVFGSSDSPFGKFLIAIRGAAVCWLAFYTDREAAEKEFREFWKGEAVEDDNRIAPVAAQVFQGGSEEIAVEVSGSPLQIRTWRALANIPLGKTVNYGELARAAGHPTAIRAVATAIGKNNVSFLIPCHRVVRKNGEIGQFRWGTEVKKAILDWEKSLE